MKAIESVLMPLIGMASIMVGLLYIARPAMFRRCFWTRTSFAQQIFSPGGYLTYIRVLGLLIIFLGVLLLFWRLP